MPSISKATAYNWNRLDSDTAGKLTTRANKTLSARRVVAANYLKDGKASSLLEALTSNISPVKDVIYTLCVDYLKAKGLWERGHVQKFFSRQAACRITDIQPPEGLWDTGEDVLGFVYQSLVSEGERNASGLYYTNRRIVDYMLSGKVLRDGETFLDPCCGSGAFLMGVTTRTPECLYGLDNDAIAVMIAGTNLLAKYADYEFVPHVYCADFLEKSIFACAGREALPASFDNVYTNPPWGGDKQERYVRWYPMVKSKERASMVVVEALERLKPLGAMGVLLPTSILKIKAHQDIRRYILTNTTVNQIDLYANRFDGVYTDYFSIQMRKQRTEGQSYMLRKGEKTGRIVLSDKECLEGHLPTEVVTGTDASIISKMESKRNDTLSHSMWALGIVTGNNKAVVCLECADGMEPVYTGKQVMPFLLQETKQYLHFAPEKFQQCAKENLYRAPEKLMYRFISKYPVVAYDDGGCLCLNSANILIPDIEGISVKSVAALLNSTLYRYYYQQKFPDIKVLKTNLQQLPFPRLSVQQDQAFASLVDNIRKEGLSTYRRKQLDSMVCSIFGLTQEEQHYIQTKVG